MVINGNNVFTERRISYKAAVAYGSNPERKPIDKRRVKIVPKPLNNNGFWCKDCLERGLQAWIEGKQGHCRICDKASYKYRIKDGLNKIKNNDKIWR